MMTLCATVSRPPVLEREVEVFVNTADYTAGECMQGERFRVSE